MQRENRRLAAIVAADIAGYSRLIGQDEEGTLRALRAHRQELIDRLIDEHGGRIANTAGDSLLLEFSSVVDAVRCALDMQRSMATRNDAVPADRRIEFRVGINLGDVIAEGTDLMGDGVNVAARLQELSDPGGIVLSNAAHEQVRDKLDIALEDMSEVEVKNIARPIQVWRWLPMAQKTSPGGVDVSNAPPLPDKPSIAVLPFDNMSGDPEQEYFADGMAEDIITGLSRNRAFFVIARNSTFTYKGAAVNVTRVARELGVRYVVEGSVRKAGNRLRISAQLIDATSGNHVWAERYDRELDDIFAVQDEITQSIVAAIAPETLSAEMQRARRRDNWTLDAWDCTMQAMWHAAHFTKESNGEALRLLEQATELNPSAAIGFATLSYNLTYAALFGWSNTAPETVARAHHAAETAVALDDRDASAHWAHGVADFVLRRHEEAIRRLQLAIELDPSFANAHAWLGGVLAMSGSYDRAGRPLDAAMRLSPREPTRFWWLTFYGLAEFAAGRYGNAVDWATKAIELDPQFPAGLRLLASALGKLGQLEEAQAAAARLKEAAPAATIESARAIVPWKHEADMEDYLDGLRKADVPEK